MDSDNVIFHLAARVQRPDAERSVALLDLVRTRYAHDAAMLDERAPFFWAAEISNSQVDFYHTRMLPNTLSNFAEDARRGVSFQNSHRTRELPLGRSLDGHVEMLDSRMRVVADFYTIPGLRLTDTNTDDLIVGIRSGLITDVSVGFGAWEKLACDICGRDFFDRDCPHIPGMKYEVEENGVKRTVVSTFAIDNAHLFEVSGVYDGATPDATILKAERMAGAGLLKPEAARLIEQRFRITLPGANRAWAGYTAPPSDGEKGNDMGAEEQLAAIRAALELAGYTPSRLGLSADVEVPVVVDRLITDLAAAREAEHNAVALEAEAADGRTYRADLLAQAIAEGVRALGDKFNRATYEIALKGASLDTIRQMRDDWATIAQQRFPGGRETRDDAQNGKPAEAPVSLTPDSAYRV